MHGFFEVKKDISKAGQEQHERYVGDVVAGEYDGYGRVVRDEKGKEVVEEGLWKRGKLVQKK